jgi:hypothetical protein
VNDCKPPTVFGGNFGVWLACNLSVLDSVFCRALCSLGFHKEGGEERKSFSHGPRPPPPTLQYPRKTHGLRPSLSHPNPFSFFLGTHLLFSQRHPSFPRRNRRHRHLPSAASSGSTTSPPPTSLVAARQMFDSLPKRRIASQWRLGSGLWPECAGGSPATGARCRSRCRMWWSRGTQMRRPYIGCNVLVWLASVTMLGLQTSSSSLVDVVLVERVQSMCP